MSISKEAIEAGARVIREALKSGRLYTTEQWVEAAVEAALPHLQDCKVSPETVQSTPATATQVAIDDEAQRVARVMATVYAGRDEWDDTGEGMKNMYRIMARAAIPAIREGGQRWGVWCKRDDERLGACDGIPLGPTTDREYLVSVIQAFRLGNDYEVRPYPGEREKTAEQIKAEEIVLKHHCGHVEGLAESIHAAIRDAKENSNG